MPVVLVLIVRRALRPGAKARSALVGLAAFLGHLWPVFFRFQGGKGVATAAGVLLGFNPWLGAATLLTWVIIAAFFRYSSLASIVAAVFAPFYQLLIWGASPIALAIAVMSLLLIWRHSGNIRKLLGRHREQARPEGGRPRRWRRTAHHGHGKHDHAKRRDTDDDPTHRRRAAHERSGGAQRRGLPRRPSGHRRRAWTSPARRARCWRRSTRCWPRPAPTRARVLRAQIFLADMADFPGMNAVWDQWVVPGHTPARATVQAALAKPQWKVEIVITAALP